MEHVQSRLGRQELVDIASEQAPRGFRIGDQRPRQADMFELAVGCCSKGDRLGERNKKPPPTVLDESYWLGCFFGDDLRHCPMFVECTLSQVSCPAA
jgi:hypothetical protein